MTCDNALTLASADALSPRVVDERIRRALNAAAPVYRAHGWSDQRQPALVRLAGRLPKGRIANVRQEHTAKGHHRAIVTPFPRWVPREVLERTQRLAIEEVLSEPGAEYMASLAQHASAAKAKRKTLRGRRRTQAERR